MPPTETKPRKRNGTRCKKREKARENACFVAGIRSLALFLSGSFFRARIAARAGDDDLTLPARNAKDGTALRALEIAVRFFVSFFVFAKLTGFPRRVFDLIIAFQLAAASHKIFGKRAKQRPDHHGKRKDRKDKAHRGDIGKQKKNERDEIKCHTKLVVAVSPVHKSCDRVADPLEKAFHSDSDSSIFFCGAQACSAFFDYTPLFLTEHELLQAFENWAKEKYEDFVIEITYINSNDNARKFYENMGYKPIKTTLRK